MTQTLSFQDQGSVLHCFGCGADNQNGLHVKSFWEGEQAVAVWKAKPFHCGEDRAVTTGGILATLIDCHCVNLAIAHCYKTEGRAIGSDPRIFCVSAKLNISFIKPAPLREPLSLRAKIEKIEGRKFWTSCQLSTGFRVCATAEVLAIRLRES